MLNEVEILSDLSGSFNPEVASHWNIAQITQFAHRVYESPDQWGIIEADIIGALRHSWPIVRSMLNQRLVFDQRDPARAGAGYISCSVDNIALPAYTVYDYVGWLLTVCARPRPGATSENYYLPLLSCFATWCLNIAAHSTNEMQAPAMVSIAVYEKHTVPAVVKTVPWREVIREKRAFLGVSIPDARSFQSATNRATVVNHGRQLYMEECGLLPKEEDQRRGFDGSNPLQEPEKGYGRCAETFFWIFARELSRDQRWIHDIKGVALVVRTRDGPTIPYSGYNAHAVDSALANPCNASCRYLAEQINEGMSWARDSWWYSFDKAQIRNKNW